MGTVDEELRKLRMAGQMPVALATGPAGYAIGSTPGAPPPAIQLNNIEAPVSDRPPMSLAGNVTPEPTPGTAPSLNLRQMHDELLGKSLEVKLSRQPDSGEIHELRKTVITPGQAPAGMAEAFRSPGFAGAASPFAPGATGDTTPGGMPAGLRENFGIRTNPITGEMLRGMALDTGRPPAMLTPSATDWTPAATITNRMQMTKQERAADARRPIEDQMRRDQMASGERIAKSQTDAIAAKAAADRAARVDVASIGKEGKTEAETIKAGAKTEAEKIKAHTAEVVQTLSTSGQITVANTYALASRDKAIIAAETDETVAKLEKEGKIEAARVLSANRFKIDPIIWYEATEDQKTQILKSISGGAPAGGQDKGMAQATGEDLPVYTPEQARNLKPGTRFKGTDGRIKTT